MKISRKILNKNKEFLNMKNKIYKLFFIINMLLMLFIFPAANCSAMQVDLNGDKEIDIIDAITSLQIICGKNVQIVNIAGGKIGLDNTIYILQILSGIREVDFTPPEIITAPELKQNTNTNVPMAAILTIETNEPSRIEINLDNGINSSWSIPFNEYNSIHSLPVIGFRPDTTTKIIVNVFDEAGNKNTANEILEFVTEPLPVDFPEIKTIISKPDKMEPGVTLFNCNKVKISDYLIIINNQGDVIWYYKGKTVFPKRNKNGNFLFIENPSSIKEIDILGNVVQQWVSLRESEPPENAVIVNTLMFHHYVHEMPSGNLLALSREIRTFENYYSSDTDPDAPRETASVAGDVIVEFQRDGSIVNEWKLFDLLDPYRIAYNSTAKNPKDWSHCNSVIYDPKDDSIIVSVRHQDAVIKISRSDPNQLIWILGTHDNWNTPWQSHLLTPKSGLEWPYHQHALMLTQTGSLIMFDNGNFRASPFNTYTLPSESYSGAVEFMIDKENMEVTQIWDYRPKDQERLFSHIYSDADLLPETGNVLMNFGGIARDSNGNFMDKGLLATSSVRIIEVTHDDPAEKVFEISIGDDLSGEISGIYDSSGAVRLPGLYP